MKISTLQEKKLDELRAMAREMDLSGYSKLRKQDLIYRILEAQAEGVAAPDMEGGADAASAEENGDAHASSERASSSSRSEERASSRSGRSSRSGSRSKRSSGPMIPTPSSSASTDVSNCPSELTACSTRRMSIVYGSVPYPFWR